MVGDKKPRQQPPKREIKSGNQKGGRETISDRTPSQYLTAEGSAGQGCQRTNT